MGLHRGGYFVSRAKSSEPRDLVWGRARPLAEVDTESHGIPLLRYAEFIPMEIGDREIERIS